MAEFSRSQFPSGGWEFYQPQSGWSAPTPKSSTFDQTVVLIIKHRMANPVMVASHNLATDPVAVGNELEAFTKQRLGIADTVPKTRPLRGLVNLVAAVVAGLKTNAEWLGKWRKAVPAETSLYRARICFICPQNHPGDLLDHFTEEAAKWIRKGLELRDRMGLSTPYDAALGTCLACNCPMKLKVHTPPDLVIKRLKPEQRRKLDVRCWILDIKK